MIRYFGKDKDGLATGVRVRLRPGAESASNGYTNPGPTADIPGWPRKGFDRTHLVAARFGASNIEPKNYVMMRRGFNRGIYKRFENWVAEQLKAGYGINYAPRPIYEDRDPYPHGINVRIERINPRTGVVEKFERNYWTGD